MFKIFRIPDYDKYIRKQPSAPFDLYLCTFTLDWEIENARNFIRQIRCRIIYNQGVILKTGKVIAFLKDKIPPTMAGLYSKFQEDHMQRLDFRT